jgi:aspartate 1-decarboxylase
MLATRIERSWPLPQQVQRAHRERPIWAVGNNSSGDRDLAEEFPMLRTFVNGKIYGLKVTGLQPMHDGSCLICPQLLAAAGIEPFERVEVYSLTSTARIATYVFPGAAEGEFTLNGGAALHFQPGDQVAVVAYRAEDIFSGARCVIVDPADNSIMDFLSYDRPDRASQQRPSTMSAHPAGAVPAGCRAAIAISPSHSTTPLRA